MTTAAITAAAILRCRGNATTPVKNARGVEIGRIGRNTIGFWEAFYNGAHLPGAHLTARDAIVAVREEAYDHARRDVCLP